MGNEVKDYLNDYCDFVTKVTSEPSLNQKALFERMEEIETSGSRTTPGKDVSCF